MMDEIKKENEWAKLISDIILERERRGISQTDLGKMTGMKQSAISRLENLEVPPQIDTLVKVVSALGLELTLKEINVIKENAGMKIKKEKTTQLKVELSFCTITVSLSDDDAFHLISEKENEFLFTEEQENTLVLTQNKRKLIRKIFNWIPIKAELKIPSGFNGDFIFTNEDGRAVFKGIAINNLDAQNRNGRLIFEDIKANNIIGLANNGRTMLNNVEANCLDITAKNGRVIFSGTKAKNIKAVSKNGRVLISSVDTNLLDIKSNNGSIILDGIKANLIKLLSKNGRIAASVNAAETEYSMEVKVNNGKSVIAGKKTRGSYIYKDKDKKKHIFAHSHNGSVTFVFSDSSDDIKNIFAEEVNSIENEIDEFSEKEIDNYNNIES